jgi:hypothetical protein
MGCIVIFIFLCFPKGSRKDRWSVKCPIAPFWLWLPYITSIELDMVAIHRRSIAHLQNSVYVYIYIQYRVVSFVITAFLFRDAEILRPTSISRRGENDKCDMRGTNNRL